MARQIPASGIMVDLYVEAVSGEIAGEVAGEANGKGGGRVVIDSILRTEHKIGSLLRNFTKNHIGEERSQVKCRAVLCRYRIDQVGPDAA